MEVKVHVIYLDLGTKWLSEQSALYSSYIIPGERDPATYWIGGWLGPVDLLVKGKVSMLLCRF